MYLRKENSRKGGGWILTPPPSPVRFKCWHRPGSIAGIYKGNFPIIAAGQLLMEREGEYSNCKLDI